MSQFTLDAAIRSENEQGKGASRRLRKQNRIPAIVYGGDESAKSITLKNNQLVKAIENETFFASLININIDGQNEEVVIKALQRHPAKGFPMHADFQRVVRGQTMNFTVPLHFIGKEEAKGTEEGGVLQTNMTEVEITCLPRQLPEAIDVDVSSFAIGDSLRLSDLTLPEGITITQLEHEGADRIVVSMQPPVLETEETTESEAAEGVEGIGIEVAEETQEGAPSEEE